MAEYRRNSAEIEAFCWTAGPDQLEEPDWIVAAIKAGTVRIKRADGKGAVVMFIDTPCGTAMAHPGDYIVRGERGAVYPLTPGIFEASYELVDTPPPSSTGPAEG